MAGDQIFLNEGGGGDHVADFTASTAAQGLTPAAPLVTADLVAASTDGAAASTETQRRPDPTAEIVTAAGYLADLVDQARAAGFLVAMPCSTAALRGVAVSETARTA